MSADEQLEQLKARIERLKQIYRDRAKGFNTNGEGRISNEYLTVIDEMERELK